MPAWLCQARPGADGFAKSPTYRISRGHTANAVPKALLGTPFVAWRGLQGALREGWNCGLRGRDFPPSRRTAQAATPVANAVLSGGEPNIMPVVGGKKGA